jgi:hypothetical protein
MSGRREKLQPLDLFGNQLSTLPEAIGQLSQRLLVRTFGLIKNALHWRRGALLRYGPAIAKAAVLNWLEV